MLRLRRDILLFPEGKPKALTLSYDDGVTQDRRLIELMRTYGIKGTFNVNPGLAGHNDRLIQSGIDVPHHKFPKEKICSIYEGQEIAVHTMTHPDLATVPEGMISYEIAQCRKELEDLVHVPVTGMAYPFGTWNERVKRAAGNCGIRYSRTTKPTFDFSLPEDFLEWHPTCHHKDSRLFELLTEFLKPVEKEEILAPKLFYLWGHSYEFDAYNQWEEIEKFMETVSGKRDIWYAANGAVYEYLMAAKQLVYSAAGEYVYNPTRLDIWMMIDGKSCQIQSGKTVTIEYQHEQD